MMGKNRAKSSSQQLHSIISFRNWKIHLSAWCGNKDISETQSFTGMWISWPPSSFSPSTGKQLFYPGNIFRGNNAFSHISLWADKRVCFHVVQRISQRPKNDELIFFSVLSTKVHKMSYQSSADLGEVLLEHNYSRRVGVQNGFFGSP